jgi:thioredoxin 1
MNKFLVFKSTTCGPCKMIAPVIDTLQEKYNLEIETIWVDTDEGKAKAVEYGVKAVPTIIKISEFGDMEVNTGYRPKDYLEPWMLA